MHKTTIVITHDLSQIESSDFVYVLEDGRVVEQGFRYDLETVSEEGEDGRGEFRKMMEQQKQTGGFLPEQDDSEDNTLVVEDVLRQHEEVEKFNYDEKWKSPTSPPMRPSLSIENWMFDVVADLTTPKLTPSSPTSINVPPNQKSGRRLTIQIPSTPISDSQFILPAAPPVAYSAQACDRRPQSLQFTPTSPVFSFHQEKAKVKERTFGVGDDEDASWMETEAVQEKGVRARAGRERKYKSRGQSILLSPIKTDLSSPTGSDDDDRTLPSFWSLMRSIYPTIPIKPALFLGLLFFLFNGSMTPIFSFLLSRLLFKVSSGAQNVSNLEVLF